MKIVRTLAITALVVLGLLLLAVGVLYAMFDGPRVKTELTRVVKEQKMRTLDIPGELRLSVWPSIAVTLGKASLSEPNSSKTFVSVEGARISVAVMPLLSRQVSVSAVEIEGLKAMLVKDKDGHLNFADLLDNKAPSTPSEGPPGGVASESPAMRLDVAAIQLRKAQLQWLDQKTGSSSTLSDLDVSTGPIALDAAHQTYAIQQVLVSAKGKTGADAFELRLAAPRFAMANGAAQGDSVTLSAMLEGVKHKMQATLTLQGIQGSPKTLTVSKMGLDLDVAANDAKLKANLGSALELNLAQQTVAVNNLLGKLDIAHPSMPMKQVTLPLSGHVRADLAKSQAELGLATQLDDSKMVVKASVTRFSPLAMGFDLDISQLNLDKYLPPPPKSASTTAAPTPATAQDPAISLSAFNGLDLNGVIKIGSLKVSNVKMAQIYAKLSANGGKLNVAPFSADLYQGKLTGNLSAQTPGNVISIRQTLTGVALGPLLKDVADKDMLEGRGNVVMDISTHGSTVGALKKALTGSAAFGLKDGAIKGINLAKSLREVKAKLGAGASDGTQKANADEKTDFSELSASFKIAAGVAHNEDLAMKSPYLRLAGAGDIDIGNSEINYLAKVSVVNTSGGQEGLELDQLKGLTIPVRLSGPFQALGYKIDFANLLSDAAKARVNAKLDETKQELNKKLEDGVKDRLKGLLGR